MKFISANSRVYHVPVNLKPLTICKPTHTAAMANPEESKLDLFLQWLQVPNLFKTPNFFTYQR